VVILHCRLQLVYACGAPAPLPECEERVRAVQALAGCLSHLVDSGQLLGLLQQEGSAVWQQQQDRWGRARWAAAQLD
jgi:hypothetical protein